LICSHNSHRRAPMHTHARTIGHMDTPIAHGGARDTHVSTDVDV
jgi:hypothetical protein